MGIDWRGDAVQAKLRRAQIAAVDQTMAACVLDTQGNEKHPGWKNVTGTAEGSVRIVNFAKEDGDRVVGIWGSAGVNYVLWLELKHGSFLRSSADRNKASLKDRIKANYDNG